MLHPESPVIADAADMGPSTAQFRNSVGPQGRRCVIDARVTVSCFGKGAATKSAHDIPGIDHDLEQVMSTAALRPLVPFLALVGEIALANQAYAGPGSESATSIGLGYFVTDQRTESGLRSDTGEKSELDFEGDLGLDSSVSAFRFDANHRFNDRINASIFDLSRDGDFVVDGESEYEGTTYPILQRVRTELEFAIYKAAYTYNLLRRENWRIGASAGLYVGDIGSTLTNDDTGEASGGDVTAPLPAFGLRGSRDVGDRWTFYAGAQAFFATIEDIDGFIYDASSASISG